MNFTLLPGEWKYFQWPDSLAEWIAVIVLGLIVPVAALYFGKRIRERKKK